MLYSDEVIKHFKNPGNMGKMANPDGRGEVGNPVCLLPKQNIDINNGIREIDKITAAEKILSADGRYSKIDKTTKRDYSGEVITIKNKLGNIRLTPDHLILAVKLPPGHKFLRTKNIVASYLENGANGWVEWGGSWIGNIKFSEKYFLKLYTGI